MNDYYVAVVVVVVVMQTVADVEVAVVNDKTEKCVERVEGQKESKHRSCRCRK
jgi:hypothetical protein